MVDREFFESQIKQLNEEEPLAVVHVEDLEIICKRALEKYNEALQNLQIAKDELDSIKVVRKEFIWQLENLDSKLDMNTGALALAV